MDRFNDWFEQESGYALHRLRVKPLGSCCAENLTADGRFVRIPSPNAQPPAKYPLYVCARCGRFYAKLPNGFAPVRNLLRYPVTNE